MNEINIMNRRKLLWDEQVTKQHILLTEKGRDGNGKTVYEPIEDGDVWAAVFLTSVKVSEFYYKDMGQ